jgi:hypothetical protein
MKTNRGKGEVSGQFEILWGYWNKQKEYLTKIDAVTKENIKAAAGRFLVAINRSVVTLVPQEPPKLPTLSTPLGKEDEEEEEEEEDEKPEAGEGGQGGEGGKP